MLKASPIRLFTANTLFLSAFWILGCASAEETTTLTVAEPLQERQEVKIVPAANDALPNLPGDIELASIDNIFRNFDNDNTPGCAVAVFQNGQAVFNNAYGIANLDYGIPISDSTSFYMGSVSKQFTAAAAGLLVIRGEIDLDADVADYIEKWPGWAKGVKIRHLFSHTSGLPDVYDLMSIAGISLSNVMNLEDYLNVIMKGENLAFRPGTKYSFTDSGYTVLAYLIQEISGQSFSSFVDAEILKPLGMNATHFHDDRHRVIPNRAVSYERQHTSFRQTYLGNFQGVGGGGLYSTLRDWERWERFWHGSLELSGKLTAHEADELKKLLTSRAVAGNNTLDYGMGLDIQVRKGQKVIGHNGSFMGFETDYRRYPELGVSMVTLCNRGDANPQAINNRLADMMLLEQFEAYLAPFQGIYQNDELPAQLSLTIEDGELKLNRRLSPNGLMRENGGDTWNAGSWDMVFQRNGDGVVEGFVVSTSRAREVEFRRVQ